MQALPAGVNLTDGDALADVSRQGRGDVLGVITDMRQHPVAQGQKSHGKEEIQGHQQPHDDSHRLAPRTARWRQHVLEALDRMLDFVLDDFDGIAHLSLPVRSPALSRCLAIQSGQPGRKGKMTVSTRKMTVLTH